MGSSQSQSSLGDRRRSLKGSSGHLTQLDRRPSVSRSVNVGDHYERLNCWNENSARSSPEELGLKEGRVSPKSKSSLKICPCFHYGRQPKSCGDAVPGQSSDSVALLRESRCSDRVFPGVAKTRYDGRALLDQHSDDVSSQERISAEGDDARGILDEFQNETCSVAMVSFCGDIGISSETETNMSDGWNGRNDGAGSAEETEHDTGFRNERWLMQKCRSFLHSLRARSKSKSDSEWTLSARDVDSREDIVSRRNHGSDHLSNAASYEDSGKASETETCRLFDRGGKIRAPIAKIDSLETTSIESLDSDDLMLDTASCSCPSVNDSELPRKLLAQGKDFETGNLKTTSSMNNGTCEDSQQGLDAACTGTRLKGSNDETVILIDNTRVQKMAARSLSEERERLLNVGRHLSCPFPEANKTPVCDFNLASLPFDIISTANEDFGSSCAFEESSNRYSASDGECVLLNRETYSDVVREVETFRTMLFQLGTMLIQKDVDLDDDSKKGNDPLAFEEYRETSYSQTGQIPTDQSLMEKLTLENSTLRAQIRLLRDVAAGQEDFISKLQQKLDKIQKTSQKSDIQT